MGKFVKVKFDGLDWIYVWKNSAAVSSVCFYNPCLNYSDLDLFLFKYKPKIGDVIIIKSFTFQIESVDLRRIKRIKVTLYES